MTSAIASAQTNRRPLVLALGIALLSASQFAVSADEPPAIGPPTLAVGDRWTWNVEVSLRDYCSNNIPKGAQTTETVTKIGEDGYVTEITGPTPNTRYSRTYANDGSYKGSLDGKPIRSSLVAFPLRPGSKWETTLVSPAVVTTLDCAADKPERMKLGAEDLEVVPITCEGSWKNRQYGNSGTAVYKQWYSPVVGASVRRTVWTRWGGKVCVDLDYRLESYTRAQ